MDLSPRAQERLARIGALSDAEAKRLNQDREVEALLAPFFTGTATTEDLWRQVRELSTSAGPDVIRQAQEKLVATFGLQMTDADLERRKAAVLALETLKKGGKHSALELLLGSIISLRQRYNEIKEQALNQVREQMEGQVQAAAAQARRQGMLVDTASTLEASLKASPEWRDFVTRHDAAAQKTLNDYLERIRSML